MFLFKQLLKHTIPVLTIAILVTVSNTTAVLASYPWLDSFDQNGNQTDEFLPGSTIFVKGDGFEPNAKYDVWITGYDPRDHVKEYDYLPYLSKKMDSPGLVGTVTTDALGKIMFEPVWTVQGGEYANKYYELIIDGPPYGNSSPDGVFDAQTDGVDAYSSYRPGLFIFPELSTVILFSLGLLGIMIYIGIRKWRTSNEIAS